MKSFLHYYDAVTDGVTKTAAVISGALIMATCFMIVYEIISRGVFHSPTEWVMEISTYCIIIAGFLGIGCTYRAKKHIRVDLLFGRLSPKVQCWLDLLTSVCTLIFAFLFLEEALDMTLRSLEYHNTAPTTLSTPLWIPQVSMPVGMAVLFLEVIRGMLHDAEDLLTGHFEKEDA